MSSQSPAPWTFAARAAYFGDRVCAFCHHHNPAGARFCNECASPLQLKPCDRCDAVNDYTASSCHNCGVTFPLSFGSSEAASASGAELPAVQGAIAGEVAVAATAMQRPSATSALRAYWRSVRPAQFLFTAIATILIAGAYGLHHLKGPVTPDAIEAPSQATNAPENAAPVPAAALPLIAEPKPAEPETTAALQAPLPASDAEEPKPVSELLPPTPVPAAKRASARQGTAPERQAPAPAPRRLANGRANAHVDARAAENRQASRADPLRAMHVSLARCSGDLFSRIVCDQRVRQRFCAGRWGTVPECASFTNEHGQ